MDSAVESETPKSWRFTSGLFDDATNIDVCEVIKRSTNADPEAIANERDSYSPPHVTYTVVAQRGHSRLGPLTVSGVPRAAIVFFDHMYANDQYNRKAFRHEIAIPNDMVPEAWRDLK